jgi:hypothetical protein
MKYTVNTINKTITFEGQIDPKEMQELFKQFEGYSFFCGESKTEFIPYSPYIAPIQPYYDKNITFCGDTATLTSEWHESNIGVNQFGHLITSK